MKWEEIRSGMGLGVALLLVLCSGPAAARASAQTAPAEAAPAAHKSAYGTLESVDKSLRGLIMKSNEGKRIAWRFEKAVIEELANFKPGSPVIVIYRQRGTDKAVTAVAFPGATATPTYVNSTGERLEFFSGAMVNGVCGAGEPPFDRTTLPVGGIAETTNACWCCAPAGEGCTPANKTGVGKAFLTRCYK